MRFYKVIMKHYNKIKFAFTLFVNALMCDSCVARFVYGTHLISDETNSTNAQIYKEGKAKRDFMFFHNYFVESHCSINNFNF